MINPSQSHDLEISSGKRFEFGANWARFLAVLNEDRIRKSEDALKEMLGVDNLQGKTFLDIGSGSGLSSLAARRLGATVRSFDYDPQSVSCTDELRRRYFPDDEDWVVTEGSALDTDFLKSLGKFDIVYSWGVLHHTGAMWQALENAVIPVKDGGQLFVAIYNDQGWVSNYWTSIKRLYNSNTFLRNLIIAIHLPYLFFLRLIVRAVTGRLDYERGMSLWYDMIDWLGGLPFEYASPNSIIEFYLGRKFSLNSNKTVGARMGCNEFVFKKL